MATAAAQFYKMSALFELKGENDDHEIFKYHAQPKGHILVAFRYKNSNNIWRKCLNINPGYLYRKSEHDQWYDAFVKAGHCVLIATLDGERTVCPSFQVAHPPDTYFNADDEMEKWPWFLLRLDAREQADLDDRRWENFSEDPRMYRVSYGQAYQIPKDFYEQARDAGWLVQAGVGARYYVAF